MKNIKQMSNALLIVIILSFPIFGYDTANFNNVSGKNVPNDAADSKLVIYAYKSLLEYPGFDFIGAYANYSNIQKEDIELVPFDDANSIVTRAILEKNNPVADVIIGVDNALIYKAKSHGILTPYDSPSLENISSDLIENLDNEKYALPYDYGIIALYYNSKIINSTSNPELDNLTLEDIVNENLDVKLITEDPALSSTGLGFFLWTIAVYGDPTINFQGLLGKNWRDWWNEADEISAAASWDDAISVWSSESGNRSIMVSYGTSPAYNACVDGELFYRSTISHENSQQNAWLQIEGIGLVNNSQNTEEAKRFIDWFLNEELQSQIPENNWMYPANINANISQCFTDSSLSLDGVNILNNLISPKMISENLDMWQSEWEEIYVSNKIPINIYLFLSISFFAISYLIVKNQRKLKTKLLVSC